MSWPCWRDPEQECDCSGDERLSCAVPIVLRAKEESMRDVGKDIAKARLVFTVDDDGTIRKIKDTYGAVGAEQDIQAMVEEIANLRLAHLGIDARYENGEYVEGREAEIRERYQRHLESPDDAAAFLKAALDDIPWLLDRPLTIILIDLDELDEPDEPDTYGDTGVARTEDGPYQDAAADLESRGIDASVNVDLVDAWAHALEVADATD